MTDPLVHLAVQDFNHVTPPICRQVDWSSSYRAVLEMPTCLACIVRHLEAQQNPAADPALSRGPKTRTILSVRRRG